MKTIRYQSVSSDSKVFWMLVATLVMILLVGVGAASYMEHEGHWVTGMTNSVVWGMPHVFAIFLIVAASGALNVASISSVFGKTAYKPLSRLSGLLAVALLVGGLMVLVLDLGRPDRLIEAMTYYNFKSIFAWNIFLYTGFLVIVAVYLWMMFERRMNQYTKPAAYVAFIWRLILTTGTGSIFGFLVARQGYDAAVMAPLFIIMFFSFGTAFFILFVAAAYKAANRPLGEFILFKLKNLLGVFVAAVFYFVFVQNLTNLYATEHHDFQKFILLEGGVYTILFWLGQILLGTILPLLLFFLPRFSRSYRATIVGSLFVLLGAFAQLYVIVVGGQAYPLVLFPGMDVSSSFFDGVVHSYIPSLYEILLGLGGVAIALLVAVIGVAVLDFLPESLEDAVVDPHYSPEI